MKPTRAARLALILAISIAFSPLGALSAPPPAEAFASLPAISELALSPNGQFLAWADRTGADGLAVIYDLNTGQVRQKFAIGKDYKLHDLNWSDDKTLLVDLSQTDVDTSAGGKSYEIYRTLAINLATGKGHILLMTGGSRAVVTGASLLAWRTGRPGHVIMTTTDWEATSYRQEIGTRLSGHREDSGWITVLFDVDTETGSGTPIEKGTSFTNGWIVDRTGRCLARSDWDPKLAKYRLLAKDGAGWREIYSENQRPDMDIVGPTPDGTAVLAIGPGANGRRVLWSLPLDGSSRKVLYEDPAKDVELVETDRFDGSIVGVMLGGQDESYHWIDPRAQKRFESLSRAFKGLRVEDWGRSEDGTRVLARVEGPSNPAVYYLIDYGKHTANPIGDEYPALANVPLGEVRAITYKARDGTSIPAFLTLPPGTDGKNLPLIVLPHGGPAWHDSLEFDWWTQFLATRGYAVLQPQFRGSTGYGDAFSKAGYHQWGLLMQDDVTDGAMAMFDQGIANPKRTCIAGWSYGGYSALAGAAFTPDLYRCAVSVAGVSDLPDMIGWSKAQHGEESNSVAYWIDHIGSPFDKNVIERSPARAAANIQIPVLLLHGQDDTVVPISQSETMAHAMTEQRKNVTLVKFPGQDHGMLSGQARLRVLTEMEKFLAANL